MIANEPSLTLINAFFDSETRNVLYVPLAAVVLGALSQVETAIELADRVCDQYFQFASDGS